MGWPVENYTVKDFVSDLRSNRYNLPLKKKDWMRMTYIK